jgi:hypothetical protein
MAKQAAFGASIKITSGTVVANVTEIKGPGISLDVADVTSHDSSGAWEENVATILRSGEVTLSIAYDPAAATIKNASGGLLYNMVQRLKANYTLIMGGASFIFDAWVTGFEPTASATDALTAEVKMKITGAVTIP